MMFKFTYILLFFAFINAKAQEPDLVWRTSLPHVKSMFILNDTTLLMHADYLRKSQIAVTWFVDIHTGEIKDSLFHGVFNIQYTKLSPNKKILAVGNWYTVTLIDIETKQIIKEFNSNIDIAFKDDENIYVFYDYGIHKINIITDEKELIWLCEDYQFPQYYRISLNKNSRFSQNGKYAVPITLGARYINLETKELLTGWRLGGDKYYPVFNPVRPNELIVIGEYLNGHNYKYAITIVDMNVPGEIKGRINLHDEFNGTNYATCSEDGKYLIFYYFNWMHIYDLETYELKSNFYLHSRNFIVYNNFLILNRHDLQDAHDISSFLGVNYNLNQLISVFPNPNNGLLTFNFDLEKSGKYDIKIINSVGQEVYKEDLGYLQKGQNNITKELTLINGTYYTTITNGIDLYKTQFIIKK